MEKRIIAVKRLIIDRNWPPRWVAEKIGVSIPTVYRWVKEDVKSVTETHLDQLASLANLKVEFSRDRKECQFVEIKVIPPSGDDLPAGHLERINKRMIQIQTHHSKYNKGESALFFEGEDLLEKIYSLKMEDYKMVKQLIKRLSQKE
jgi:transcriptional regulator with XRE-family HTH domain|tara:strand:+ start:260 stop:700 length:441 start_codon:yes stop_codon:yes gene_type:complete